MNFLPERLKNEKSCKKLLNGCGERGRTKYQAAGIRVQELISESLMEKGEK